MFRLLLVVICLYSCMLLGAGELCKISFGKFEETETTYGLKVQKKQKLHIPFEKEKFEVAKLAYRANASKLPEAPKSLEDVLALLEVSFEQAGLAKINLIENLENSSKSVQKQIKSSADKIISGKVLNKTEAEAFFLSLFYLSHQNVFSSHWLEINKVGENTRRLILQKLEWSNFYNALESQYKLFKSININRKDNLSKRVMAAYAGIIKHLKYGLFAPLFLSKWLRDLGNMEKVVRKEILEDFNTNFLDFMEQAHWRELEIGGHIHLWGRYSAKILTYALVGTAIVGIYMSFHFNYTSTGVEEMPNESAGYIEQAVRNRIVEDVEGLLHQQDILLK